MTKLKATLEPVEGIETEDLVDSLIALLETCQLCTLATLNDDGTPYANTCYFAFTSHLELVVLTPPSTRHAANSESRPEVAGTIFDTRQAWGTELAGLQFKGRMTQAHGAKAVSAFGKYAKRFAGLLNWTKAYSDVERGLESRFFVIEIDWIKLFDEPRFGKECYLSSNVSR